MWYGQITYKRRHVQQSTFRAALQDVVPRFGMIPKRKPSWNYRDNIPGNPTVNFFERKILETQLKGKNLGKWLISDVSFPKFLAAWCREACHKVFYISFILHIITMLLYNERIIKYILNMFDVKRVQSGFHQTMLHLSDRVIVLTKTVFLPAIKLKKQTFCKKWKKKKFPAESKEQH